MTRETLHVVAHFRAHPDRLEELREVLNGLIAPTRAEAGCLRYELFEDREDPNRLTFIEEWTGDDALAEHFQTPHILAGRERFPELLAEPLDVRRYRPAP